MARRERMIWNIALDGAELFLDGLMVPESESDDGLLTVSADRHELQF